MTAIITANDRLAIGCYDTLAGVGLSCPDDVSIVGFNDMMFIDRLRPPLSSVRVPQREIGYAAADLLLEQLADDPARRASSCSSRRWSCAARPRRRHGRSWAAASQAAARADATYSSPLAPSIRHDQRHPPRFMVSWSSSVFRCDSGSRSSGSEPPTV